MLGKRYQWHGYQIMALSKFLTRILNPLNVFCISCHIYHIWENVSPTEPDDVSEVLKQSLWNNKYICKGNSNLYYPCLSAKGINKIGDIFSDSGTLLQWKDAIGKFNLQPRDIMQWLSVCISIPAIWKSKLNEKIFHGRLLRGVVLSYII